MPGPVQLGDALAGKRILFVGCTGFVGRVALSMLLHRYHRLGRLYAVVRTGLSATAEDRFFGSIATSRPFDPLRERHGEDLPAWLRDKVVPLGGDVTRPGLGLSDDTLAGLQGQVELVLNCAGLVNFDPPLDQALRVNTLGVREVAAVAARLSAAVVHVSTCYVAGERDGEVWEDEPVPGYFPRRDTSGAVLSVDREIADCQRIVDQVKARAGDAALQDRFREAAAARIEREGGNPDDERALRVYLAQERKRWTAEELSRAGMERARHWGWQNTYCYTKSMGEQVLVGSGVRCAIVRPAIVESALAYPFPGWNAGFTTSAPLAFVGLKGQREYPMREGVVLDLIPVDMVAGALLAVCAATARGEQEPVYQIASGDTNPLTVEHTVELLGLYKRRYYRGRASGSAALNRLKARLETIPVERERFRRGQRLRRRALELAARAIDRAAPRWGAPRIGHAIDEARERVAEARDRLRLLDDAFDLFLPFTAGSRHVFRTDAIRRLRERLDPEERARLGWEPESIDWRSYFLDVHMAGLHRWIFPDLERDLQRTPRRAWQFRDLAELFETVTRRHARRVALRMVRRQDGVDREERWSYADLHAYATHAAGVLRALGVQPGDRVLIASENRPEWVVAFFGAIKAGATCVPVDWQLRTDEVANLCRAADARVAILSERAAERHGGLAAPVLTLRDLCDQARPAAGPVGHTPRPDDVASLIFTSGTTGRPKGVMLTHRNFCALIAQLSSLFDVGPRDGLLGVLPLHHTFEFSCGLLMPLSRGAQISYLDPVEPETIRAALGSGRVSLMVGVPALWQALHRRVQQELADRGPWVERSAEALADLSRAVRDRAGVNLGRLLFWPVHERFGGRLRALISGGSALPPELFEAFDGMGFTLYEGYGLTEAAPVLAVNRPGRRPRAGSVGEPLPNVEIAIHEPDESGVGEVIARGPNVMAGYYGDREATDAAVRDGWLFTGDLGRIEDGRLAIVGRRKDVILSSNGKNVYPDEVEDLYRDSPYLKEVSVVGLADEAGGEKVAALAVPDYDKEPRLPRDEVRRSVEEHFRAVAATLPWYQRIKVLHLRDGDLPRTATRKVKRPLVVQELVRLERAARAAGQARAAAGDGASAAGARDGAGGLRAVVDLVASLTGRPAASIRPDTRLVEDLGFDSLMYADLGAALEAADAALPEGDDPTSLRTVADLARVAGRLASGRAPRAAPRREQPPAGGEVEAVELPGALRALGRRLLRAGQRAVYDTLFQVEVTGRAYLPRDRGFIVAANHTSHLDMGLCKHALGAAGENLRAIAARDYFFGTRARATYFANFTNVVPMERHGSVKESLQHAVELVRRGHVVLIFPEGTRSPDGRIHEFRASLGYLALAGDAPILPMWLGGTHQALPKGSAVPKRRDLRVHIGPAWRPEHLRALAAGKPRSEAYRAIAKAIEEAVRKLALGQVSVPASAPAGAGAAGEAVAAPPAPAAAPPAGDGGTARASRRSNGGRVRAVRPRAFVAGSARGARGSGGKGKGTS